MKALLIPALLLWNTSLFAADNAAEIEVRQCYEQYAQAVRAKDSAKYMGFLSDNFFMKSPDGKVHDHAEMTRYQQVNADTTKKVNSYTADIESVVPLPNGDLAVIVLQKYDREQAPADAPDKAHRIQTSAVQRETCHKEGGSWKIRSVEEILVGPVLMDGKPLVQ